MPAKSKQQQKFMGIVRAIQQGDEPASKFSKSAQDAAEDMKEKDVEDFASTKHKGLPKKVEQYIRQKIRKSVEEMIKEDWFDRLSSDDQKKYVKAHPNSKKAKQAAHDKEREAKAKKIRRKGYTIDGDGNVVKVKKTKEDPKKHAKHMAALKKGYMPGDDNYEKFVKEDYVETCGYTQSVDGKKLKTPGGTGEEDRELKEAVTFRGAKGRSVVVPNEYVGKLGRVEHKLMKMLGYTGGKHNIIGDWNWGYNSRQKMKPNDEFSSSIILRSHPYIKGGRRELQKGDVKAVIVTLNKLLRASGLKIEKSKSIIYRPDRNNPMIEFRVEPRQFKESVEEERDYKAEYKKYGSSTKAKKYRAELNQYNRKNGTYGNGDGKDASHKGGKIVGFEKESTNRGRAEKSRLKKESVNENRMYKKGDVVSLLSFDRRHRGKARVKGVTKARPNKFGINNHYITNKGTFSDMEVEGTKAFKLRFKGNTEKKVMKALGYGYHESVNEAMNPSAVRKMRAEFERTGELPPHLKKFARDVNILKKKHKVKNIVVPGLEWMSDMKEQSVNEGMTSSQGKEVLRQLGGGRFIAMTGAKNFGTDGKSLTFKIGRNSKGVNFVRIKLTSMDLYDIEFLQVRAGKIKIKSKAKRVYADQLGKMFKKNTGMNVRL